MQQLFIEMLLILSCFILISFTTCFIPKIFRIMLWSGYLFVIATYYILPQIKNSDYLSDTDEYYDLKNYCNKDETCVIKMIAKFQDEIAYYYNKLNKQNMWDYTFIDWQQQLNNVCNSSYNPKYRANCLYHYSYIELQMLRKEASLK